MARRGNPYHDERGRFCSGSSVGLMSSADIDRANLKEGSSVKLKTDDGSMHPLFHSNPDALKGKREYEQALSVERGNVTLHTKLTLNGTEHESVDIFEMSYPEFREFVALTKTKKDSKGDVCWEFDMDAIGIYEGATSELKDYLWYDEYKESNVRLDFSQKGFSYEVSDENSDTLEGGDITRDGENFVITPWNGRPVTFKEGDAVHAELKDYFRIKDMCDLWT